MATLNHQIIEFYDKLSAWEHDIVRGKSFTLAQIHTVEVLGAHGTMRMKALSDKLGITTGTLTVQVDKLVAANIIERHPHQTDRRSIVVGLTPLGYTLYNEHNDLHLALTQRISAELSTEQKDMLLACFSAMNEKF
ncbi:MarR family transcriptional regulator [Vibrio sp. S11_S32]|nr:MarR family transcriptional regulator [Vibrio sp. S11_S32]